MFDESGRPQGYGQYSPFRDQPKPPGEVPQAQSETGAGSASPSVPPDPTLNGWRQPNNSMRKLGDPHVQPAMSPTQSNLQTAIGGVPKPPPPPAPTSNPATDWRSFVDAQGATGTYGRTHMGQLVDGYNAKYGTHAVAGNPNASGTTDTVNFNGDGKQWTDVIHGGDDAWQFYNEPPGGAHKQVSPFLSSLLGQPTAAAPDQTGNNNPLLNAIRQQLMQTGRQ